tara:strand:+ start:200 stop:394 length:195 start_codon:yes stop_codon:yes gene_type:complete
MFFSYFLLLFLWTIKNKKFLSIECVAKDFRKLAKEKGLAGEGNPTRPKDQTIITFYKIDLHKYI